MRTYSKFLFTLCCFISCAVSGLAQGVSMSPTRLFFTGNPGETVTQNVIMYNNSDNDYVFNINLKDWNRSEDGTKVYFDPGVLDHSNSEWVSTLETNITLPSKSTKEVLVSMTIPEDASKEELTNSMLFFTQIGKQTDKVKYDKGIGIIALFEFGLHIYYTPSNNTTNSLEIVSIETSPSAEQAVPQNISIRLFNDGNIVNDAAVEIELTNTSSGEEIKLDPINISMMPGTYQTITQKLPKRLSGQYLGVIIVKMSGTNDLRVGEKTFDF